MSIFSSIIGLPCDEKKSVDRAAIMTVLGMQLQYDRFKREVRGAIDPLKAVKWAGVLSDIETTRTCAPGAAAQMAGR